ncbi:MAG: MCE family protein [Kiritimatiellae bacterium]|nr:MCE family protein [Kiritimatiellia bacterium]
MNKKTVIMETSVGLFAVAVFALLFLFTVVLSREAFFRSTSSMRFAFADVMGLRVGDNVVSRGVTIGKVDAIDFTNGAVIVTALLNMPIQLRDDYRAEVVSSSLLGGRNLQISEGTPDAPLLAAEATAPDAAPLVGAKSAELIDSATHTVEDIRNALNDGILEDLKAGIAALREVAENLASGQGTLGHLVSRDDTLYNDLSAAIADLRSISSTLASGQGTLGHLLSADDTLYNDLSAAVADLRSISDRLEAGEGTLGRLLSKDDTMYNDLSLALANFRTVSDGLANGQGTLGKLLADDTLYDEVNALVGEGRAAIDDLRETSPITTFSSVFFGVF